LVRQRAIHVTTGDEIGKMVYGTGTIPFVRTSDISNWEIKTDPKQGVSEAIYKRYTSKQDVQPGDILFVRDGTYLVGSSCLITANDVKIVFQSHILKFRLTPRSPLPAPLLLALLSTPVVRRQIRAKQFTADIIDSIGNRYLELVLPVPREPGALRAINESVSRVIQRRNELRERLRRLPLYSEGRISNLEASLPKGPDTIETAGTPGFLIQASRIKGGILVPRYYDPGVDETLARLSFTHDLVPIGNLAKQGVLALDTGIEVGKLAYGTGPVPFIRTSDISNWELKSDPKQSVSEDLYNAHSAKVDVCPEDIFVVRDGTYLVGDSCMVGEQDARVLYCAGIYKVRVLKRQQLDPYLLLSLLHSPIVRRQMRAKQFTRDVIDTLGRRFEEIVLPIPKNPSIRDQVAAEARQTILERAALRDEARLIPQRLEGITGANAIEEALP